jgi:[ribosomal protein S18]-alanine N-acetyltransferase
MSSDPTPDPNSGLNAAPRSDADGPGADPTRPDLRPDLRPELLPQPLRQQPLQLSPLRHGQIDQALELDRLCFDNLWTAEGYSREIDSDRSDLLLLEHPNPELPPIGIGCLWAILNEGHITLLGIHPDYRGQGLGGWLLVQLLRSALARSLDSATLEVRVSNKSALMLYDQFGFRQVGRRRAYYQDSGEDALILCRPSLQQPPSVRQLESEQRAVTDRLHRSGWCPI